MRPRGNLHIERPGAFSHGTLPGDIDAAAPLFDH